MSLSHEVNTASPQQNTGFPYLLNLDIMFNMQCIEVTVQRGSVGSAAIRRQNEPAKGKEGGKLLRGNL